MRPLRAPVVLVVGWLVGLAAACGGKAVIDGDTDPGNGEGGSDPLSGVACGSAGSCTFSCCLDLTVMNPAPFCATTCSGGTSSFTCDGPEDCDGELCCGDILGAECKTSCDSNDLQRCHTDGDCGGVQTCMQASVSGVDASTCG